MENWREATRVALFGGSFDPMHLGHLQMAETVLEVGCEHVILLPCQQSPHKLQAPVSPALRVAMMEATLADSEWQDRLHVSDYELRVSGPSYSWKTVEHFRQFSPTIQWSWVLGDDQWLALESWSQAEYLRENVHFYVLGRSGTRFVPRVDWSATRLDFDHPASSTLIRGDVMRHKEWLAPGVHEIIDREALYH